MLETLQDEAMTKRKVDRDLSDKIAKQFEPTLKDLIKKLSPEIKEIDFLGNGLGFKYLDCDVKIEIKAFNS